LIHWAGIRNQFQAFVKNVIYVMVPCNECSSLAIRATTASIKGHLSMGKQPMNVLEYRNYNHNTSLEIANGKLRCRPSCPVLCCWLRDKFTVMSYTCQNMKCHKNATTISMIRWNVCSAEQPQEFSPQFITLQKDHLISVQNNIW